MSDTRTSPLHPLHEAAGAVFTDFGGWSMPVRYSSDLAEHHAVRTRAGLFDVSHMAEIVVDGPQATDVLDYALASRLSVLAPFQAKYTLLLDEDGGIVDDLIVYRLGDTSYLVIANAGNRSEVVGALVARAEGFDAAVADQTDEYALIALQGPLSQTILEQTAGITDLSTSLSQLGFYRATDAFFQGSPLLVARTGYTGEDGFELCIPVAAAAALWQSIIEAGAPQGLIPAGLAARDTLRLEAGMPLYGHELTRDIRPEQAGLAKVVALDTKGDFVGRSALEQTHRGRVLVGLTSDGRRAGRSGYSVHRDGEEVGAITSGALSPTLGHPIALAYVDAAASEPGTALSIDVRGTSIPATVTPLPFYRREN